MSKTEHLVNIVTKPWGYEYLIYENKQVAIWALFINFNQSTSLHCHSKKTTGLIVINGECEVSFIEDSKKLRTFDKIMIRKGLFHSTKSISEGGSILFEIETPNDKQDLVRLKDSYGRENKPYENEIFHQPRSENFLWFTNEEKEVKFENCLIKICKVSDVNFFKNYDLQQNFIFIKGGIVSSQCKYVVGPGDITKNTTLNELCKVYKTIEDDTYVMVIMKNE